MSSRQVEPVASHAEYVTERAQMHLEAKFGAIARRLNRLSDVGLSIDLDGYIDEPCSVAIRFNVDWLAAESGVKEVLRDLLSALEVGKAAGG